MKKWKYDGQEWFEVKEPEIGLHSEKFWLTVAIYLVLAALVGAVFLGFLK